MVALLLDRWTMDHVSSMHGDQHICSREGISIAYIVQGPRERTEEGDGIISKALHCLCNTELLYSNNNLSYR